jgi:hypothetical protein
MRETLPQLVSTETLNGIIIAARCSDCGWNVYFPPTMTFTEDSHSQVEKFWLRHLKQHHELKKKAQKDDLIDPYGGCAR